MTDPLEQLTRDLAEARDTITALRGHLASSRERVGQLMGVSDVERKISNDALAVYGVNEQLQRGMEECCELGVAISHYLRGRDDSVQKLAEEIADVELVCVSLREVVGDWLVDKFKVDKWARLRSRVAALRASRAP